MPANYRVRQLVIKYNFGTEHPLLDELINEVKKFDTSSIPFDLKMEGEFDNPDASRGVAITLKFNDANLKEILGDLKVLYNKQNKWHYWNENDDLVQMETARGLLQKILSDKFFRMIKDIDILTNSMVKLGGL